MATVSRSLIAPRQRKLSEKTQIEADSPILEPITFTLLTIMKEKSWKQGVAKTRDGQVSRPEPWKSLIIHARQEMTFQKGGTSTAFQGMREGDILPLKYQSPTYLSLAFGVRATSRPFVLP